MGFLSRKSLKLESLEKRELFSVSTAPGVGWAGQGADLEYVDLNNNGVDDVIAMAYDAPSRSNHFRFRIGYDVNANGEATRWSDIKYGPSLGWEGQGAGLAVTNLDGDSTPDIVFMAYDNPARGNTFRYIVGYDMQANGSVSSWSSMHTVGGVGWEADGAGIAIGNLNWNSRPDAILMAYDDPAGANTFRYKIAYDLDANGRASSYSAPVIVPGVGWAADGAGIELGNLDNDPRPDVIVMAYDAPSESNTFRMKIGYNIDWRGHASKWSSPIEISGMGWKGDGAGVALQDFDRDGEDELVFMAYDDPERDNEFRFRTHEIATQVDLVGSELVIDVGVRGGQTTISQWYSYLTVGKTNLDGSRSYEYFRADDVSSIRVNGSDASDQIQNNTNIPSRIEGNGLMDSIIGGRGNDRLYGGEGTDFLFGLDGNDSLFGGIGSLDLLNGGPGKDRFLQPQETYRPWYFFGLGTRHRDEDRIVDFSKNYDAEIEFHDEDGKWTNREIKMVDEAFAMLHDLTGNTRLLRDSVRDDSLRFYRYRNESDQEGCGNLGCNYGGSRHIYIGDASFSDTRNAVSTVIHEIGHHWDEASENPFIPRFRAHSGWIQLPDDISSSQHVAAEDGWHRLTTAEFSREYGGNTDPFEDFATAFTAYVMTVSDVPGLYYGVDTGTTNAFHHWFAGWGDMPEKIKTIAQWVDLIS